MQAIRIRTVSALVFLLAGTAAAAPPPETSLNNCQNAVKTATKAFVTNKIAAIGTCLQAVSTQIIKNDATDAHAAAATCVTQFRKINDSRGLSKQLSDKLAAAIIKKCHPSLNTHTLADIIGTGAGVSQPLDAENLNAWCSHYGGDGSIDTLQEWIDCVTAAAECDVDSTIASQYPRALEWMNLVKPSMQALAPPIADTTKITDAVAALDAIKAEIDGPDNDNIASIQCGGMVSTPLQTGQTQCDQGAGTLGACPGSPADQDGALQKGLTRSYTDNANGTITDNKTGMIWEKLDDNNTNGIHDYSATFTWYDAFKKIQVLNGNVAGCIGLNNPDACCSGAGTGSCSPFAGQTDWRLPNVNELQSLADYGRFNPSIDPAFNASCAANCTAASCSCTQSYGYWSATTIQINPGLAWLVYFTYGPVNDGNKAGTYDVRAVRGGL